jgi:hypothetical protein
MMPRRIRFSEPSEPDRYGVFHRAHGWRRFFAVFHGATGKSAEPAHIADSTGIDGPESRSPSSIATRRGSSDET